MGKGAETRERILDQAVRLASRDGLDGLTIGALSAELGLSKSGLFAHFGSKDELQLQVLQATVQRFEEMVIRPAVAAPRGEPRLRTLFENWLAWGDSPSMPGGCLLVVAAVEFDDRPGPQRDFLEQAHLRCFEFLAKGALLAVEAGHFRSDLDADQFAFEVTAIVLGHHHIHRMLRDPRSRERARAAFERLLADARVT
jgi:AcrR family transcriptional regulator